MIPLATNCRVWLDGNMCSGAQSLELEWTIKDKEDPRIKGTLVCRKLNPPEEKKSAIDPNKPCTITKISAFLPLTRVIIPVWVKDYRVTGGEELPMDTSRRPKMLEVELYTDVDREVKEELVEAQP